MRSGVAVSLGRALLAWGAVAHARSHTAGTDVPAVVRRAVPATVSVTTRRIEHDQFDRPVPTRGLGSGFSVDRRGFILTNGHVVEGAEQIKVTLADERTFKATLVGSDPVTDLAVLKIDGTNLPALRLGSSARLRVGETVVAIGSPLWIERVEQAEEEARVVNERFDSGRGIQLEVLAAGHRTGVVTA